MSKPLSELRLSYNHCHICGRVPRTMMDEANVGPVKFWGPDDGWVVATLCRWCYQEHGDAQPDPGDFAYGNQSISVETDEDPILAF